jgi:hypothetical protein
VKFDQSETKEAKRDPDTFKDYAYFNGTTWETMYPACTIVEVIRFSE